MQRAFTLIELLVVIAIISILAAIMFPVFSSAKAAAHQIVHVSNMKQLVMAHGLYAGGNSGKGPPGGYADPEGPMTLDSTPYVSWAYAMSSYVRSPELFQHPLLADEQAFQSMSQRDSWYFLTHVGYAYTVHAPVRTDTGETNMLTDTQFGSPSTTVLYLTKKQRHSEIDWYLTNVWVWGANLVNPPLCSTETISPYSDCYPYARWGSDGQSYEGQRFEQGGFTGGVAFLRGERTTVAWLDGHVSSEAAGSLAQGTNWTMDNPSASVMLTDESSYVWDQH